MSAVVSLCVLYCAAPVVGQESKPWWNLFATTSESKGATRDSSFFDSGDHGASESTSWKLPSWPWGGDKKTTASRSAGSTAISRMGKSTKRAWENTVDFLNPFDAPSKSTPRPNGYQPQNEKPESKGGWFGWLRTEEPPEPPATVTEFLSQDRPRYP